MDSNCSAFIILVSIECSDYFISVNLNFHNIHDSIIQSTT